MGHPAAAPHVTYAEYLELLTKSPSRLEWLDGVVFDMAGGSPEHAALQAAVAGELRALLRGKPCRVFGPDLKVRVRETGLTTFPDASVVCGALEKDPEDDNAALNPIVLVEVLSDSTEGYDRGEKFAHYRRLPSVREYVLVSQRRPLIEVFRKNAAGKWELAEEGHKGDLVPLTSVGVSLSVDDVYANPLGR